MYRFVFMKKIYNVILMIFIVLLASACGMDKKEYTGTYVASTLLKYDHHMKGKYEKVSFILNLSQDESGFSGALLARVDDSSDDSKLILTINNGVIDENKHLNLNLSCDGNDFASFINSGILGTISMDLTEIKLSKNTLIFRHNLDKDMFLLNTTTNVEELIFTKTSPNSSKKVLDDSFRVTAKDIIRRFESITETFDSKDTKELVSKLQQYSDLYVISKEDQARIDAVIHSKIEAEKKEKKLYTLISDYDYYCRYNSISKKNLTEFKKIVMELSTLDPKNKEKYTKTLAHIMASFKLIEILDALQNSEHPNLDELSKQFKASNKDAIFAKGASSDINQILTLNQLDVLIEQKKFLDAFNLFQEYEYVFDYSESQTFQKKLETEYFYAQCTTTDIEKALRLEDARLLLSNKKMSVEKDSPLYKALDHFALSLKFTFKNETRQESESIYLTRSKKEAFFNLSINGPYNATFSVDNIELYSDDDFKNL